MMESNALPIPRAPLRVAARLGVAGLLVLFSGWLAFLSPDLPAAPAEPARIVHVVGGLNDDDLTANLVNLAVARPDSVYLLDSANAAKANEAFLTAFKPTEIVPVGSFPEGAAALAKRLGVKPSPAITWRTLFPTAAQVVVCPAQPRRLYLHAATLAGALRAPMYVLHGGDGELADLQKRLDEWKTTEVLAVGKAAHLFPAISSVRAVELADEATVFSVCVKELHKAGPINNLVVTNPSDASSALAPWIAVQKRAALVLTNEKGEDAADLLRATVRMKELSEADCVLLVGGLKAIPMEKRVNPAPGKDTEIEMEPGTPKGEDPFPFATGRLFHDDPAVVALMLARKRLLAAQEGRPRKALVVSNPGGGLPMLETFSRNTAQEFRNIGYQTTTLFGEESEKDKMRKLMPEQDVFLWEGHYRTLIDDYEFLKWTEPLPPALYFMQSCLALKQEEADLLWQRGAVAVVGSSTRIYSATGGAFTLAYFNAMFYDDQTLGGSLRQAKNFLLAYARLKDKRLGQNANLSGANLRSAWAFSLWGDPTLKLPHPPRPMKQLSSVTSSVRDNTLLVSLPETTYDKVKVGKYEAQMMPNARLAGLLTTSPSDQDNRVLVPFVYAEVALPQAPSGQKPKLSGKVPETNWVFCWDARRRTGYLLVTPRPKDRTEMRFKIEWEKADK